MWHRLTLILNFLHAAYSVAYVLRCKNNSDPESFLHTVAVPGNLKDMA